MTDEYDIDIYHTSDGKEPFTQWLDSVKDREGKRTILIRLQRIRQGNFGDCEAVADGVQELRIHLGPGYRIYFAKVGSKLILLLGGGSKKKQSQDIKKCKEYLREYRGEKNDKKIS